MVMSRDSDEQERKLREADFERHIVVRKRPTSSPKMVHPYSLRVEGTRASDAGELEQAGHLFERALCLAPDNVSCLNSYGQTLVSRGRLEDALACFQRAVAADPQDTRPRHALGRTLRAMGRYVEAVSCYQGILRIHPADITARVGLGQSYRGMGRLEEAANALRVATKQSSGDSASWTELAQCWREMGRLQKALGACRRATRIDPLSAEAWKVMGWTSLGLDLLDEAAEAFRAATKLSSDDPDARAGLAAVRMRDGDLEGAESILSPLVESGMATPCVASGFADLRARQGRAEEAISVVADLVERPLAASERISLAFALGDLWEVTGRPEPAMAAWTHANALCNSDFDPELHRSRVDKLISTWDLAMTRGLPLSSVGGRELVFIVGMPRSGVNLVETVLSAHPAVYPAGRNSALSQLVSRLPLQLGAPWPECMERFKRVQPDPLSRKLLNTWIQGSGHAKQICISDPLNSRYLGFIGFLFPLARIVHVTRNPRDTLLSCFAKPLLGQDYAFASSLEGLACAWTAHQRRMDHWRRVLDLPILELRYEDLVRDPGSEISRLGRFLDLRGVEVCETFFDVPPRFGAPAPLEPPRPLDPGRIGRWQSFETWLGPIGELEVEG
jgi:Flp pilus assembly protein TadD